MIVTTDLAKRGSNTAKNGFKNEQTVVDTFNQWQSNHLAQEWLIKLGYEISNIEYVKAEKVIGHFKADIQVFVKTFDNAEKCENIQVKLVSNKKGFNQIDKRWLEKYNEMWNIPSNVYKILQYYTGEIPPYKQHTKDHRRMYINEMENDEQVLLIDWLEQNKSLIIKDIFQGSDEFKADWVLVIRKTGQMDWVLKPISVAINHYLKESPIITNLGNIRIGKMTIQRKGGDGGRKTATMLQFKIDPTDFFED